MFVHTPEWKFVHTPEWKDLNIRASISILKFVKSKFRCGVTDRHFRHCLWITNFSTDISFVGAKVNRSPLINAQVLCRRFGLAEVQNVLSS
jgi:hypothetical protein